MNPYYADDSVTLYHGDCREVTEWLAADVLVMDPPYGRAWRQGSLKGHAKNPNSAGIANDDSTAVRDEILATWGSTKPAIVFGDLMLPMPVGTKLVGVYQKDITCGLRGAIGGVRRDAEAVYLIGKWSSGIGGRSSVFATKAQISGSHGVVARTSGHPHAKPGDVMTQLLELTTGVIADPTSGGGSTLVTAKALGRKAIGIELEEKWCEIIARRLSQDVLDFEGGAA